MQQLNKVYLEKAYSEDEKSTYEIAEECGTYPNKVRRALLKFNIKRRDKSEAQSKALETGRHKHPTRGQKRKLEDKIKISASMEKVWNKMSAEEKERRVSQARHQWENMSEEDREAFKKAATEAVRKAADEGSKLERYLLHNLQIKKYDVHFHREDVIKSRKMQLDLYIPKLHTVIEVDGPAHFYPIWGEDNLAKHIISDHKKTGLVIAEGLVMIRVKNVLKNVSEIQKSRLLTAITNKLQCIESEFPNEESRLIEIEVK